MVVVIRTDRRPVKLGARQGVAERRAASKRREPLNDAGERTTADRAFSDAARNTRHAPQPQPTPKPRRFMVRPLLGPADGLDVTDLLTRALAEELWRRFGGNDLVNWIEAERLLAEALTVADVQPMIAPPASPFPTGHARRHIDSGRECANPCDD